MPYLLSSLLQPANHHVRTRRGKQPLFVASRHLLTLASLCTAASSAPCASLCFCAACTAPEEGVPWPMSAKAAAPVDLAYGASSLGGLAWGHDIG
ncbi:hypothetical protein BDA96_05G166100 [Sorghum bicolor]|uniref:Uncharacterized protein n=2 Tax=Sorghum bicolor TaxID=4558 RepID=A0A921QXI1_SORBI|nr:hypothetical protein BDA96_05G166100 [Sorghum bicolor]OQU83644.1 hypothetical protein SORBI_3005G152250 [Sorghum bicolor]